MRRWAVKNTHLANRGMDKDKQIRPNIANNLASLLKRSNAINTIIKAISCGLINIYTLLEYFSKIEEVFSFLLEILSIKSAIKPVNAI